MKKIIIAIDGFSGCGKSTMAKNLAQEINYTYIDSGAMYRAVTLFALQNHLFDNENLDQTALQRRMDEIIIKFENNPQNGQRETLLNGLNVENRIRSMDVSDRVSIIGALPFVRERMVKLQQDMGIEKGIVMDGRDIGEVVFPMAELKIFVTASPEIRAQRRLKELREKGDDKATYSDVLKNIEQRDYIDQHRSMSPLRKAPDAIELDNSCLSISQQQEWLLEQYQKAAAGQ
jgi:cytidylate kinase